MGDLVLQSHWEEGKARYLTVVRADRDILITHQLLCDISETPTMTRLMPDEHQHEIDCVPIEHRSDQCFNGALLYINGHDRHLLYRIREYLHGTDCWKATLEYDN